MKSQTGYLDVVGMKNAFEFFFIDSNEIDTEICVTFISLLTFCAHTHNQQRKVNKWPDFALEDLY